MPYSSGMMFSLHLVIFTLQPSDIATKLCSYPRSTPPTKRREYHNPDFHNTLLPC